MSFAHLRLSQITQDDYLIKYLVESFDFNPEKNWQPVGTLIINKKDKIYDFQPGLIWQENQILPPFIYGLNEDKKNQIMSAYQGYGGGAWAMQIHHWATVFIKRKSFPLYHPLTFFPSLSAETQGLALAIEPATQTSIK
ncbi:hypothetical protein [Phormidium nigroviride]